MLSLHMGTDLILCFRLAFFKAAYALFDSDFYVKADDDIYLRPGEQETDNIQDICSRWLRPTYTNFLFVRFTYTNIHWIGSSTFIS